MFYYASLYSFKLLCSLRCNYVFYYFSALTLLTVSSIVTLFPAVYASSIFKSLFLLQRLLKHLLLLKSIVWLFLFQFLSVRILAFRFLKLFVAVHILRFLCTAKVHWFWSSVSLSQCLLWCSLHWILLNVALVGLFSLVDSVVNLNYFVNQLPHILGVFHKY